MAEERCTRCGQGPAQPDWGRLEHNGQTLIICPDCHAHVALTVGEKVAQHARDAAEHAERAGATEAADSMRKLARLWESEAAHAHEEDGS